VENWLVRNGQSVRLRELLWDPLVLAALNQPSNEAAAPTFARVLAEMFGDDPGAAAIVLPTKPLHLMYAEPARAFLERHASEVKTGVAATVRVSNSGVLSVAAGGDEWTTPRVVAAVPWFAFAGLFDPEPPALAKIIERTRAMASSPIVTVNMWFDRRVFDEPFIGLPGRAMQWIFDKRAVFGEAASHLSLVSSGASKIAAMSNSELIALATRELIDALPAVRDARLLRASVVREPRATFSLAPGQPARPVSETPVAGLFLAGDWIDTGLPATIESAVRSGHHAAALAIGIG
jgi:hypothetical protein